MKNKLKIQCFDDEKEDNYWIQEPDSAHRINTNFINQKNYFKVIFLLILDIYLANKIEGLSILSTEDKQRRVLR